MLGLRLGLWMGLGVESFLVLAVVLVQPVVGGWLSSAQLYLSVSLLEGAVASASGEVCAGRAVDNFPDFSHLLKQPRQKASRPGQPRAAVPTLIIPCFHNSILCTYNGIPLPLQQHWLATLLLKHDPLEIDCLCASFSVLLRRS
jgi:hypothetical protein